MRPRVTDKQAANGGVGREKPSLQVIDRNQSVGAGGDARRRLIQLPIDVAAAVPYPFGLLGAELLDEPVMSPSAQYDRDEIVAIAHRCFHACQRLVLCVTAKFVDADPEDARRPGDVNDLPLSLIHI